MSTEPKSKEEQHPEDAATAKASNTTNDPFAAFDEYAAKLSNLLLAALSPEESSASTEPPIFESFDLATAAKYMLNCQNIIVMCGAGISTSAGIPDFRTPDTGLYSQLEKYNLPTPESVFDLEYFRNNPKPFFLLKKEQFSQNYQPTPTHYFLRLLHEKRKLLRVFTQNVDGLEKTAGLPDEKVVEAHGTFATAHCLDCRKEYSSKVIKDATSKEEIPYCDECKGIIKPDVVFFGESLPEKFSEYMKDDFPKADFLIIIGTSLAVAPFNTLPAHVSQDCPRLLINIEPVGEKSTFWNFFQSPLMFNSPKNRRDIFHKSTCDEGVAKLAELLKWTGDFNKLLGKTRPSISGTEKATSRATRQTSPAKAANRNSEAAATGTKASSSTSGATSSPTTTAQNSRKSASPSRAAPGVVRKPAASPVKQSTVSTSTNKLGSNTTTKKSK